MAAAPAGRARRRSARAVGLRCWTRSSTSCVLPTSWAVRQYRLVQPSCVYLSFISRSATRLPGPNIFSRSNKAKRPGGGRRRRRDLDHRIHLRRLDEASLSSLRACARRGLGPDLFCHGDRRLRRAWPRTEADPGKLRPVSTPRCCSPRSSRVRYSAARRRDRAASACMDHAPADAVDRRGVGVGAVTLILGADRVQVRVGLRVGGEPVPAREMTRVRQPQGPRQAWCRMVLAPRRSASSAPDRPVAAQHSSVTTVRQLSVPPGGTTCRTAVTYYCTAICRIAPLRSGAGKASRPRPEYQLSRYGRWRKTGPAGS